ncbi:MAG: ABC transporter substrate-binding protein [bacterium]
MRRAWAWALASVFFFGLCAAAQARQYKVGTVPWVGFAPAHVAEAKGFWKSQGLDVKVFNFPSVQAAHTAFEQKRIDIDFDMMGTAVSLYQRGLPVVIIAESDWSHGGDKVILRKGVEPAALKGKPAGVYLNQAAVTYFLNSYLKQHGLSLADLKVVEMETAPLAKNFIEGRFNLIVSYDPDALRAEKEGNGVVAATSADYEGVIPEGMMVLQDVLKDIPREDLTRYFKGWVEAVKWCHDPANWKEYMQILNTKVLEATTPFSEQDLKGMLGAVRIHDARTQLARNQDGGGLQLFLDDIRGFLKANQLLQKDFTTKDLFRNEVLVEVLQGSAP